MPMWNNLYVRLKPCNQTSGLLFLDSLLEKKWLLAHLTWLHKSLSPSSFSLLPKSFPFSGSLSRSFFFQPACHLILYVCSQWLQPLYPGSHSIVTANVSFLKKKKNKCEDLSWFFVSHHYYLVTVTLLGAWGVVFSIISRVWAVNVATSFVTCALTPE